MYFSGLKKAIESLEEKRFYDVALLYLSGQGYKDLSIIDGPGDGGRDVTCSRPDLRIQLSVRKDWDNKINGEAGFAIGQGKRHLLYITNRSIPDNEYTDFVAKRYKYKGEVEVSLVDLRRLSSALSLPGILQSTCEVIGIKVGSKVTATPAEVALSNYLLFSRDAREFRQEIFESNIRAVVYKNAGISELEVINALRNALPGAHAEEEVKKYCSSLSSRGILQIVGGKISLEKEAYLQMQAAEQNFLSSIALDVDNLCSKYSLSEDDARNLIGLALELIARDERIDGNDANAIDLMKFLADKNLLRKKDNIFDDLSNLNQARVRTYGSAVNHIFATNTFDIYRALGKNTQVVMLLDSSVAMPMIFGLSFGAARSRYGLAAASLHDLCRAHGISIKIPRCYLNEMASHGLKALDFVAEYNALSADLKDFLRDSGNAYLSHFSHIRRRGEIDANYTLSMFLNHFGVRAGVSLSRIENSIESVLQSFDIEVVDVGRWSSEIRQEIKARKPRGEPSMIIDHDAQVATYLKNQSDVGYVFSTWDKVLTDVVEGLSRILADSPARIFDFLSMAVGSDYESRQSISLLTTLLYIDEKKSADIAAKIEKIKSSEKAYQLSELISGLRERAGDHVSSEEVIVDFFLRE